MNGNFEVDKGRYPYGPVAVGDGWKLMHIPTQQITVDQTLPLPVASTAALRLNTQYHAWKAGGDRFDGSSQNVGKLIRESTRAAFDAKHISGAVATQIGQQLDNKGL